MAQEIVLEELRLQFGVTYLELNDTTKRRILPISPEQLTLEEERVALQRVHDAELQLLLQRYEEKRLQMYEEEANVYFTVNNELKSLKTGNKLAPVCAEEMTEWRGELIHTAATLEALEVEIQRVEDAKNKDSDIYTYNKSQEKRGKTNKKSNNNNDDMEQVASLQDEARYLLSQIRQKREALTFLHQQMGDKDSILENDIVRDKNSVLGKMHCEYNRIVVQQQEEISKLREELQKSAESFGINVRWIAEQNIRNSVVNETLHNSHSK
ncbi:hypothetical protein LSM04_002495 [Trypanosoma melophagium]|uniref:uncharacterized protein n=1 Tax=Trypanosoma melophagium TaxID=715481 RepID=UPI00351A5B7E|nr:hypothetical protein LSM04_002495 [Trypanosoma melophagium]